MFKLACIYVIFSLADLLLTIALIVMGDHPQPHNIESNPLARIVILSGGLEGLFIYKMFTVALAIVILDILYKNEHKRHPIMSKYVKPEYILIFGILLTAVAISLGVYCLIIM